MTNRVFSKTELIFCTLMVLLCFHVSAQPSWQEVAKSVWKTSVGEKQGSLGNFDNAGIYWSSTQAGNFSKAWAESFGSGYQDNDVNKTSSRRVRAIRAF